uniref:Nhl repeat containing 2 n=1 Tax=Nannochloropsis gaditana (strain CCMP526) TaxID=1093141 RepID=I2CRU4_NANGC
MVDLKARDAVSTLRPSNAPVAKIQGGGESKGGVHMDTLRSLEEEGKDPRLSPELGARRSFRWPVQLALLNDYLYVAAAGSHQIWRADPYTFDLSPLLGCGECAVRSRTDPNYSDLSSQSAFASPTGIVALPGKLLVSEAESSTIREIDFRQREAPLSTLLGNDRLFSRDLSAFGDADGYARSVRLQCPMALAGLSASSALLADTYNHKVKVLQAPSGSTPGDPAAAASVSRLAGSGKRGYRDGAGAEAEFDEPRGLCVDGKGGQAFVCDSNNHCIRTVDLRTGEVGTLKIKEKGV